VSDDLTSLEGFGGTVRLFPLPNLVLYPFIVQPLHVFEPRYRQLMADALAGDRLMALALLKPGWEGEYHQRPTIYPTVCVGRIFKEERLTDGRYNLLLHGVARARVVEELPADKLYRLARVEVQDDVPVSSVAAEKALREELSQRLSGWFTAQPAARDQFQKLLHSGLGLGTLCDVFAFALPLDLAIKQQLLEEAEIERRARHLLEHLDVCQPAQALSAARQFPPEFSAN
jgi:Lon protease-like protein